MYKSPELPVPREVWVFPEEAKALWLTALERPEADLRRQAAEAIALAHRRGVKGFESMIAPLLTALDRPEKDETARLAIVRALVTLDARSAASNLFKLSQSGGSDLREIVEPALARWDFRPARDVWLARLPDHTTGQRDLMLAMQSLGLVREKRAAEPLRALALSEQAAGPIRLEAARALAALRADGLEKDAEALAGDASPRGVVPRLVAVSLLCRHQSQDAVRLLERLMDDREPTVAARAVERLSAIDSGLVVPAVERLLKHADARIRALAVEVLFQRPSENHIRLLGTVLDDVHMDVRIQARRRLTELAAKSEWQRHVAATASDTLATRQWRGLEQAAILLTELDHKPAAKRLVELLGFERPEVFVTAAWGLRRLAVPETLTEVARFVDAQRTRLISGTKTRAVRAEFYDHQLSQLNQFLGQEKHAAATTLLKRFVPRTSQPMPEARAAAIWALGLILDGPSVRQSDASLAIALEERLNDGTSIPPEDLRVRVMSAVTLGRLRAKGSLASLQKYFPEREPSFEPLNNACGWAIAQITGQPMPAPKTIRAVQRDWFLVPNP